MPEWDPFSADAAEAYTPPVALVGAAVPEPEGEEEHDDPRTGDSSVEPPELEVTQEEILAELGDAPATPETDPTAVPEAVAVEPVPTPTPAVEPVAPTARGRGRTAPKGGRGGRPRRGGKALADELAAADADA